MIIKKGDRFRHPEKDFFEKNVYGRGDMPWHVPNINLIITVTFIDE